MITETGQIRFNPTLSIIVFFSDFNHNIKFLKQSDKIVVFKLQNPKPRSGDYGGRYRSFFMS